MAIKIDGRIYVTCPEASNIMNADKSLMSYWIYHGEFSGIIDLNDLEIIQNNELINEQMNERLKNAKVKLKKNSFLVPLDQVIDKMKRLEKKRELIKAGKSGTLVENPLEAR